MLSNEDLLAISDLLDKKFKPIDTKTDRLKEEVNSLRIETQAEIQNIKRNLQQKKQISARLFILRKISG